MKLTSEMQYPNVRNRVFFIRVLTLSTSIKDNTVDLRNLRSSYFDYCITSNTSLTSPFRILFFTILSEVSYAPPTDGVSIKFLVDDSIVSLSEIPYKLYFVSSYLVLKFDMDDALRILPYLTASRFKNISFKVGEYHYMSQEQSKNP